MWETIIVQPFTNLLLLITMLVKNFGIAIILFTLLIKLITYPLTSKQLKSSMAMQDLQNDPKYKKMMEKYKGDREKTAEIQMKVYKEKGVNPFGSCLPTLIQLPIIIGLYQSIMRVMASTPLELVKLERIVYPFLDVNKILPIQNHFLWMDLGQPERLWIGNIGIPVLAILVLITTYIQSKIMQPPTQSNDQGAAMSNSMMMMMPVMMGWMAYQFSAGLALYFLASNIATVVQYAAMGRADWAKIFPWVESKEQPKTAAVIEDDDEDEEEIAEEHPQPVKTVKPSARSLAKRQRPKRKK
ncbi:MAG: YidC/Oxa1 family membrane protein insertase [Anaerolineaceae bacterium]|jgi:YidC/Oxa1 family membrane protein insertase|nr:YidC/Oxa1 family membrane protein insertase [Anaerolineaceae bacterium]MDD4042031.1 YidC/Oxa1 family membrane protein insertase [Anaerolineaceae bacterium]